MEAYSPQRPSPSTEDERIIHSLNIHGVFFERWCQHVIGTVPGCTIRSVNAPVEYPPRNGLMRGEERNLDIRAGFLALIDFLR
jgi:hypothetical protein